jgi:peptide/nickel transport system permease protein
MRNLRRFFTRWQNWVGLLLVAFFVFVAIAAPLLSPNDPKNPSVFKIVGRVTNYTPQPPSEKAPLGTLSAQISEYHALVWGTRSALGFGLSVALLSAVIGVLIGAVAASAGGWLNRFLMRATDAFLSFPIIAGVVLIQQVLTTVLFQAGIRLSASRFGGMPAAPTTTTTYFLPEGLSRVVLLLKDVAPILIAFILFSWMPYARVTDAMVRRVQDSEFVQAARVSGARPMRILFRHLLPNSISPAVVMAARDVGGMVLLQATFTFIGMGGSSAWGLVLVRGRDWIISPGGLFTYWWVFLPATLALVLFGIGWNLLGDGLHEALDPKLGG